LKLLTASEEEGKESFENYLAETVQVVNDGLGRLVSGIADPTLNSRLTYALLSPGKRLRPTLAILSAQSVGGERCKVVSLALSFELVHTATLVHDDVIDEDTSRRGNPALHEKWSRNDAIVTGDALIALAIDCIAEYGTRVIRLATKAALELCEGELMDMSLSLDESTEDEFFTKTRKKSASFFKASAECGALAAGASELEAESLARFGEHFGIAYQLKDDLEDLLAPGQVPLDIASGTVTLPLIHLYHNGGYRARRFLEENFHRRDIAKDAVKEIREELRKAGSLVYCVQRIADNIKDAKESIKPLKESVFKHHLIHFSGLIKRGEIP